MRKTIKLCILLLVVAIIYFGYSAWIDSVAIFNIGGTQLGSGTNWNKILDEILQNTNINWETFITQHGLTSSEIFVSGKAPADSAIITSSSLTLNGLNSVVFVRGIIEAANDYNKNVHYELAGFMASNSLAKTLLDPFKMILVGGVFALFIPLTKQLFFGTIIGMKDYMKNRQSNVLYNYQKAIAYVEDLQTKLESGSLDGVKAAYASYGGVAFKPEFLNNMMDEICGVLIKEGDLTIFADAAKVVANSLKEMYEKERRRSINGRGDEMFFDLKRGYEYCARGSKYSIAYYESLQKRSDNSLGWKIYSLEIFKFNFFLAATLIPSIIISALVGGLVNGLTSSISADLKTLTVAASFFIPWVLLTILVHALMIFTNKSYKSLRKILLKPAIIYYLLYLLTFVTISAGFVGLTNVGSITEPGSASKIWVWFSALAYLVLSTSLIFYVLATLVDSYKMHKSLSKKFLIDGIILPLIAWTISTVSNFLALYWPNNSSITTIFATINSVTLVGFWIYLSISSFLINNLISPTVARELRKAFEADVIKNKLTKKPKKTVKP